MIDVQIVAGRYKDLLLESVARIMMVPKLISHIYIANNTRMSLDLQDSDLVTIVNNSSPLTFEQNHNLLAELGSSDYILFLDDDAFVFPGAVTRLYETVSADPSILLAGGVNNQTWSRANEGVVPKIAGLEYFLTHAAELEELSSSIADACPDRKDLRLFCPGNLMLTRRSYWQGEYGGWDESYRNWNEEIDYILWGYERGLRTIVMPGVWFFHGMSSSRIKSNLIGNICDSSRHLMSKFPPERVETLNRKLSELDPELSAGLRGFLDFNGRCTEPEFVATCNYYQKIIPYLAEESL